MCQLHYTRWILVREELFATTATKEEVTINVVRNDLLDALLRELVIDGVDLPIKEREESNKDRLVLLVERLPRHGGGIWLRLGGCG